VVSYPDRGPWGRWDYRGNTSGHLLVDLIKQYEPKSVLDPFAGSGTTRDVCRQFNIACDSFDLKNGFDALTSKLSAKKFDLIFLHPPYHFGHKIL
jgi:DNA modification methylase